MEGHLSEVWYNHVPNHQEGEIAFLNMTIEIMGPQAAEIETSHARFVSIYRAVFTQPPYCEDEADVQDFAARFPDHAQRPGFRCCVARQGRRIIGFAYGFTGESGDGWLNMVAERLCGDEVDTWLMDCFAFAELAVIPAARGQGLGGQLHDALLRGLPYRTAVLSTLSAETPALRLYRRRGWVTLLDDFVFPGGTHPYAVMGLYLEKFTADQT